MARNRYLEAAKVAIILANNEQVKGNIVSTSTQFQTPCTKLFCCTILLNVEYVIV
jgi:hypothetical protein